MGKGYVLAPGFAGVQFWNAAGSDLVEVRRPGGAQRVGVPSDIPTAEAKRLLGLGAIVEGEAGSSSESVAPAGRGDEPAKNASRDEWAAYADGLGLTVEAGAAREDIKKLVTDSRS